MTNDEVIQFVNRRGVRLSLELCGTWRWMPFRCYRHIQDMSLGYQVMQEGIAFLCFRVMFRRTRYYVPGKSLADARAQVAALGEQLEHDRTLVANCITNAVKEIESRSWLIDGRGPYEWDDDRYREEFGWAGEAIRAALEPMRKVAADWTSCPMDSAAVATARINLKQRIAALEAELAVAKQDTELLTGLEDFTSGVCGNIIINYDPEEMCGWKVTNSDTGHIASGVDLRAALAAMLAACAPEGTEGKDKDGEA